MMIPATQTETHITELRAEKFQEVRHATLRDMEPASERQGYRENHNILSTGIPTRRLEQTTGQENHTTHRCLPGHPKDTPANNAPIRQTRATDGTTAGQVRKETATSRGFGPASSHGRSMITTDASETTSATHGGWDHESDTRQSRIATAPSNHPEW